MPTQAHLRRSAFDKNGKPYPDFKLWNIEIGHDWWLGYCPQMNVNEPCWWLVTIGSDHGLFPSGNKPLPEPTLTHIYVAKWRHWATMGYIMLYMFSWRRLFSASLIHDKNGMNFAVMKQIMFLSVDIAVDPIQYICAISSRYVFVTGLCCIIMISFSFVISPVTFQLRVTKMKTMSPCHITQFQYNFFPLN